MSLSPLLAAPGRFGAVIMGQRQGVLQMEAMSLAEHRRGEVRTREVHRRKEEHHRGRELRMVEVHHKAKERRLGVVPTGFDGMHKLHSLERSEPGYL